MGTQPVPLEHRISGNGWENNDDADYTREYSSSETGDQHRESREAQPIAVNLRHNEIVFDQMVNAVKRPNEKRCAGRDRQRHCHCWNCEKKKANKREDIEKGGDDGKKTSVRNVHQCKDNKGIRATQS